MGLAFISFHMPKGVGGPILALASYFEQFYPLSSGLEQEMSLQIKDSGVAYFFLEFTEHKPCVLKILLPKNKAGTGRMNMLSQNQNKSNEISNLKKKNRGHETTVSITKIKTQIKSLYSKHGSKVLKIINSVGNWKICEILV